MRMLRWKWGGVSLFAERGARQTLHRSSVNNLGREVCWWRGRSPEAPAEWAPPAHEVRRVGSEAADRGFAARGLRVGAEATGRGARPPPATSWPAGREAEPPGRAERSSAQGLRPCRLAICRGEAGKCGNYLAPPGRESAARKKLRTSERRRVGAPHQRISPKPWGSTKPERLEGHCSHGERLREGMGFNKASEQGS